MRQAIHIFKKDVRHLWIEIGVALAAAGLFVFIHTHQDFWQSKTYMPQTVAAFLASILLPISWFLLIVRAVHGETLAGDNEFWPTRPYSWKSLLGAKLLLIALFANLPLLAAQAIILQAHGFSLTAELGPLLWNQVLLTVGFFLPVAAIAALTTGVVQFLIVGLVAFAGVLLLATRLTPFAMLLVGGGWGAMEWQHMYYMLLVAALAAPALLLWQYASRRTLAGRVAAAGAVVLVAAGAPLSWPEAFAIQSQFSRQPVARSGIRAGLNTNFQWMTRALIQRGHSVRLSIPLAVAGVPDGLAAIPEGLTATIEAPGGVWRIQGLPPANVSSTDQFVTVHTSAWGWASAAGSGSGSSTVQLIALRTTIDESFYQKVKDQPVAVRGDLYLTLYGNRRESKVPFNGRIQPVPGLGLCAASGGPPAPYFLTCYSALRPEGGRVAVNFEPPQSTRPDYRPPRLPSYSPFAADLSIEPLTTYRSYSIFKGPLDAVTVSSEEPVAFVRAPLEITGLRLSAYESTLK